MRATCPGARSGRMAITTLPWVVSRISSFCLSVMGLLLSLSGSVVDKTDGDRAARDGAAHSCAERQRRATLQRLRNGATIDLPGLVANSRRRIGHARLADDLAVALESEAHGHLHA